MLLLVCLTGVSGLVVIDYYVSVSAYITSSRLNRTPPIGAPKATLTPAAAAADSIYQTQTDASSIDVKYLKTPHDIWLWKFLSDTQGGHCREHMKFPDFSSSQDR